MIELHIYLKARSGQQAEIERIYRDDYVPAITIQKGFRGTTLGELCRLLGMPKSTAFGILSTLQAGEFIRREPQTDRYRLSYKMLEIGGAYAQSLDLVQEFLVVARDVSVTLGSAVHLAVL